MKNKIQYLLISMIICLLSHQGLVADEWVFNIIPAGGEVLVDEESCIISWNSSNTISDYDIQQWNGSTSSFTTIASDVSSSSYSWNINTNSYTDRYRIKVQLSDNSNTYAFSTCYFSIIELPEQFNDVEEGIITESPELLLFPNPAMNTLNIQLQNHQMRVVHFWDMTGKLIYYIQNINSQNCKTSLDELPSGEYFVECFSDNNLRFVRKLIIQR